MASVSFPRRRHYVLTIVCAYAATVNIYSAATERPVRLKTLARFLFPRSGVTGVNRRVFLLNREELEEKKRAIEGYMV